MFQIRAPVLLVKNQKIYGIYIKSTMRHKFL